MYIKGCNAIVVCVYCESELLFRVSCERTHALTDTITLVIIGGIRDLSSVNSFHQLIDGQWVELGSMSSERRECLVVSPSPDKIMIVGGCEWRRGVQMDSVEECVVVQ